MRGPTELIANPQILALPDAGVVEPRDYGLILLSQNELRVNHQALERHVDVDDFRETQSVAGWVQIKQLPVPCLHYDEPLSGSLCHQDPLNCLCH